MIRTILALLVALVLTGCISVTVVPTDLPLPMFPALEFYARDNGDSVCLSVPDTNKFRKWMDEMAAFRAAWERLRQP